MAINYIKQMNAFIEQSADTLGAKEQAIYLRLFGIANNLGWPDWFEVADSQIMRETGIGSRNTVKSMRANLISKGFIKAYNPGHRMKTKYHLEDLTVKVSKNEVSKNELSTSDTLGVKNEQLRCQPLSTTINNKHKHSTSSTSARTCINNNPISNIHESPDGKVLDFYQQNIRPVCNGWELERLSDDVKTYGADTVIKAIERAVLRNARSLGYVESILNRWEKNGYDEPDERKDAHGTGGAAGQTPGRPARRNRPKTQGEIDRERAEWFNRPHKRDAGGWPID